MVTRGLRYREADATDTPAPTANIDVSMTPTSFPFVFMLLFSRVVVSELLGHKSVDIATSSRVFIANASFLTLSAGGLPEGEPSRRG